MLSPVAATNEALHAQLSDLRRDLQQAQATAALLPQETARADEAEAKCHRLEADAATTSGQMSKLEDRLLSTEQRLQEAQGGFEAQPDRTCHAVLCCALWSLPTLPRTSVCLSVFLSVSLSDCIYMVVTQCGCNGHSNLASQLPVPVRLTITKGYVCTAQYATLSISPNGHLQLAMGKGLRQ